MNKVVAATLSMPPWRGHAFAAWWLHGVLLLLAAAFALFVTAEYGWRHGALALSALALGVVFQRCQFGFASTWRALIVRGDGTGVRAQMLWVALAALPFALLTGAGEVLPAQAAANVRPLALSVMAGAFIFGIGMQLGGACTSGSIVGAGGGSGVALLSILGFIAGAILAAAQIEFWLELPAVEAFSFYQQWGLGGALAVILLAALVMAATALLPHTPPLTAAARQPLLRGAVVIAILSVLVLLFGGQPWGFINGFTVVGGKTLLAAGQEDIVFWDFWARYPDGEEVLERGWFAGVQTTTTAAMLLGVALAAAFAGKLTAPWRNVSPKRLLLGVLGGVVMGYGAQISYGCNIGSYISALSSGSAHGWLWLVCAFAGTAVGVGVRRLVGLDNT